jgi:hypothetical protein
MLAVHHGSGLWYVAGSALPFVSVVVCWVFFYGLGQSPRGRLLTISETVNLWPQNRIFAGAMNVEALLLALLYLARNRVIALWGGRRARLPSTFGLNVAVCRVCTVAAPGGLSALALVTLAEHAPAHLAAAFVFFAGSIAYYFASDACLRAVGHPPPALSAALSWACLGLALMYPTLFSLARGGAAHARALANAGAACQYLTAFAVFLKVLFFYYDAPPHRVTVLARGD